MPFSNPSDASYLMTHILITICSRLIMKKYLNNFGTIRKGITQCYMLLKELF